MAVERARPRQQSEDDEEQSRGQGRELFAIRLAHVHPDHRADPALTMPGEKRIPDDWGGPKSSLPCPVGKDFGPLIPADSFISRVQLVIEIGFDQLTD